MKHRWNGTYSVPIKTNSDPQTVKLENGTNSGNSRKTRHRLAATYLEKKNHADVLLQSYNENTKIINEWILVPSDSRVYRSSRSVSSVFLLNTKFASFPCKTKRKAGYLCCNFVIKRLRLYV